MKKIIHHFKHLDFVSLTLSTLLVFAVAFLSVGCKPTDAPVISAPSFVENAPIQLDVASIGITNEYEAPNAAPNVDHLFPTKPIDAVAIWSQERLRAVGHGNRLEVIINDASVVKKELPRTKGIKGAFTIDQAESYEGKIDVTLKLYDDTNAIPVADAHVNVFKSASLPENASVAQRDALFSQMVKDMAKQMDAELERNIRQYMSNYIVL